MAKQQMTQAQVDELVNMLGASTNLSDIEIIDEAKSPEYDINDLFGSNEDEYDRQHEAQVSALEKSIARDEAAQANHDEMIEDGYEQVTETRYEEEWDGEGGEMVTRTEWVKATTDEPASTDQDGEYSYIPASTCYQVNRATVVNGKVTKSWFTFLYSDVVGDDSLGLEGCTADEIIALGYEAMPNDTLTIFVNNSKGIGSEYRGLQTKRHGNRRIPVQTFKRFSR